MKIKIAETFETIQGEGMFAGAPSYFIRTSGCNLRCWWCDSRYTSWEPEGQLVELAKVAADAAASRCGDVVITGGEPMLYPVQMALLVHDLAKLGKLPFFGVAHVAYIPSREKDSRVVGLSKLARLVDCFARRLQIQEQLTNQIANAIEEHLDCHGVAVVVQARQFVHVCPRRVQAAEFDGYLGHARGIPQGCRPCRIPLARRDEGGGVVKDYPDAPGFKSQGTETSELAARAMESKDGPLRERVLAAFKEHGRMSADQCAAKLGEPVWNVQPRISQLVKKGSLEDSGERVPSARSGAPAAVWRVLAPLPVGPLVQQEMVIV